MAQEEKKSDIQKIGDDSEQIEEALELVLFQVSECYVYIVSITQRSSLKTKKIEQYLAISSLFTCLFRI